MTIFILDLWHDLREKRLWPVALVLLLGLIAVPVVLMKPAAGESSSSPASATANADDQLPVVESASVKGRGSDLRLFDPKNPFKPGIKLTGIDATTSSGSSGTDSGGSGLSLDDGLSTGGGSTGFVGGGGSGGNPGSGGGDKTTARYTYVVDLTFADGDRTRLIKGMERLEVLPSQESPLLIFLGVDSGGDSAVFLVDSTLQATGEGACKPSASECGFVYLGSGSEHLFTDGEGKTYGLRIEQIRKVRVDRAASSKASRKQPEARTADGSRQSRRFVPPVLADLVIVSSSSTDRSSRDRDHR